jgi:VanZ family protein
MRAIETTRARWRVVFGLGSILMLVLALMPLELRDERTFPASDKVAHVVAFACLALTACRGWPARWSRIVAGLVLYGAAIEVLQSLVPLRSASLSDLAADVVGILAGLLIARGCAARWPA